MNKQHFISANISSLTLSLCFAALYGCGEDVTEVTNVNETTGMEKVSKYSDLPKCSSDNFGELYYASDSTKVYYCDEKKWVSLNGSDGKDGIDGKDGEPLHVFDSAGNYIQEQATPSASPSSTTEKL